MCLCLCFAVLRAMDMTMISEKSSLSLGEWSFLLCCLLTCESVGPGDGGGMALFRASSSAGEDARCVRVECGVMRCPFLYMSMCERVLI